jgi:hypothetical protein
MDKKKPIGPTRCNEKRNGCPGAVSASKSEDQALPVRARGVGASEDPALFLPHRPPLINRKEGRHGY